MTLPAAGSTGADLAARIRKEARRLGFEAAGFARLRPSDHAAFYNAWLDAGRHGDMGYLARPDAVEARLDPHARWPELRTATVVTMRYADGTDDEEVHDPARANVARYARGRDYHKVIKKKLLALLAFIEEQAGRELPAARAYVDTGPVLERELARRAGLGWFGRNTMILHPRRGSYFFLGSLLTELDLPCDAPFERDHCGTCHACVRACPTGALLDRDASGAPVIDATRCISYLTIEHRGAIPVELRPLIGNRVFGCDICQSVCPWNRPGSGANAEIRQRITAMATSTATGTVGEAEAEAEAEAGEDGGGSGWRLPVLPALRMREDLREGASLVALMGMSYDDWDAFTRGSAVRRAGYGGFRRNVAVAIGNWLAGEHDPGEAVGVLRDALADEEAVVRAHAAWALGRVGSASARAALSARASVERDVAVLEELSAALGA